MICFLLLCFLISQIYIILDLFVHVTFFKCYIFCVLCFGNITFQHLFILRFTKCFEKKLIDSSLCLLIGHSYRVNLFIFKILVVCIFFLYFLKVNVFTFLLHCDINYNNGWPCLFKLLCIYRSFLLRIHHFVNCYFNVFCRVTNATLKNHVFLFYNDCVIISGKQKKLQDIK